MDIERVSHITQINVLFIGSLSAGRQYELRLYYINATTVMRYNNRVHEL